MDRRSCVEGCLKDCWSKNTRKCDLERQKIMVKEWKALVICNDKVKGRIMGVY